jgi:hypothetical protein
VKEYGNWILNLEYNSLDHKRGVYRIPLKDMRESSRVLDWLYQIEEKTWATDADLGNLVRAMVDLFGRDFCGGGNDKPIDPIKRLQAKFPPRHSN